MSVLTVLLNVKDQRQH